jgi:hypothetical protein
VDDKNSGPLITKASLGLALAIALFASSAVAQTRDPALQAYRFVSDLGFSSGIWVNPAASGFNRVNRLLGHASWDRPEDEGWSLGQYLISLQWSIIGFGYRHDEFDEAAGAFSQGDAYTLSAGFATSRSGLGFSRTWRTVGPSDGSWEIGWILASPQVTAGLVWRDIGSPDVRGTRRPERVVGGLTYVALPDRLRLSLQADFLTGDGEFDAIRVGGRYTFFRGTRGAIRLLDAVALADWDGDGDFQSLALGVMVRHGSGLAAGVGELDSGGDLRGASLGVDFETTPQRRGGLRR